MNFLSGLGTNNKVTASWKGVKTNLKEEVASSIRIYIMKSMMVQKTPDFYIFGLTLTFFLPSPHSNNNIFVLFQAEGFISLS